MADGQHAEFSHMAAQAAAMNQHAPQQEAPQSATPPVLPSEPVFSFPHDETVQFFYRDILGRSPEPAGLWYWGSLLASGVSLADVRRGIATSAEARGRVNQLYRDILGRDAEPVGMAYWTELMAPLTGATFFEVRQGIATSEEARRRVDNLYWNILHRWAEPAGMAYWTELLATGATLKDVRRGIATSQEARGLVNQYYQWLLGRDAEPAGMAYWTDRLATNASIYEVAQEIAMSEEARKRFPGKEPPGLVFTQGAPSYAEVAVPPARVSHVSDTHSAPKISASEGGTAPRFFDEPSFIYGVGVFSLKEAFLKLLNREMDYDLPLRDPVTGQPLE
ncbi:MAG: DUF4214 domain-containing protein [Candidatus Omnitrophica bacterium]|nr:DUF4214 domain-containing protein [Candidatus Omnitrophota bacterium]